METHIERKNREHYDRLGESYIKENDDGYLGRYHRKRLDSARKLIVEIVDQGRLFDFGCGSGELFGELTGFEFEGCDNSPKLIELCNQRFGIECDVGGIGTFEAVPGPFDVVVALNVLPYLSDDDEARFLRHAALALRPGGGLLISHTNMLFDLVSFNRYTIEFYRDVLAPATGLARNDVAKLVSALLSDPEFPPSDPERFGPATQTSDRNAIDKRRVDPFIYPAEVEKYGFKLHRLQPLNAYPLPPRVTHQHPEIEATQPDWVDRLTPTLATLLSTQFQAAFVRI